ncbi:MAG: MFS transporter [Deltaproteobacteria bacterium]|nr:MFS transporter [Deltaproteobacteria bacterium]MBW2152049.1 MFS transporter [Deltaproteobacteria bacterium]
MGKILVKARKIFWGWYVVFGAFAIMVITYGVRYSFGVFVKPMFAEYNWPMTIIQLAASINLIVYACTSVWTGWLLDRMAPKWVMTAGVFITTLGLVLASNVKTPAGLYLSYGVLVGCGSAGCGAVVSTAAVGKWFHRYRGLAIGISTMGIGVGTMLMAPFAGYIVKNFGWRNGFLSIGMIMLAVGIIISQVFMGKTSPEQMGLLPDGEKSNKGPTQAPGGVIRAREKISLKPVIKTLQFWIMVFCNVCAVMTVMMTFNLQIAYAIHNGIDALKAAAAVGVIGITGSCGKFFFGWLSDRIRDAKYSAALGFFLMSIGLFVLYHARTVGVLYGFALIYGFGYGSLAPVMPYLLSDRFGRHILGAAYGLLIFFATGLGGSIGPILGGLIFDKTGSYRPGWLISAAILLGISFVILTLKPRSKRFL